MEIKKLNVNSVLIIDDEEDIREVAQLALETLAGWQVFTAESGIKGLTKAEDEQPDAILLDIMMPGMDGFSTLLSLRSNPATSKIPVIFVTAKAKRIDQSRFFELGVKGIIPKPFDPMILAEQIVAALT